MKPETCVFALVVVVLSLAGASSESAAVTAITAAHEPTEGRANRHRRVTCDLFSFSSIWVTPSHSLCAAHCLALFKGFKGGRCENGVCVCRK